MNIPTNAMIHTVPAAAQLRKVSGFNPLKFLRQTTSEKTGKTVLKLDLPYKRLWFRLACPNGRLLLNPLRITDQMAIFEAMVYMDRNDVEPLSRVTSTAAAAETPDGKYIESAQDSALNEALENAGFGIQLCDLIEGDGRTNFGSELILDANTVGQTEKAQEAPVTTKETVVAPHVKKTERVTVQAPATAPTSTPASVAAQTQTTAAAPITVPAPTVTAAPTPAPASTTAQAPIKATAPTPAPLMAQASTTAESKEKAEKPEKVKVQASPETAPAAELSAPAEMPAAASASEVSQTVIQFPAPAPVEETPPMPQTTAQAAPSATYTADMTVEEIVQRMTLDEAKAVVVTNGTCKGWTIAQVAERRAASLRFYLCSPTVDNVLKAAAQIMLEASQRKAG